MLFKKSEYRFCAYCAYAADFDVERVLCSKKGLKFTDEHCVHFRYDPLRRRAAIKSMETFSSEDADFSL